MLVSTVIPTYNYGHFVHGAIDSVLSQTHRDIECIVVDDGSTDDTQAVLARYGDKIRTIRNQNSGPSAARNSALRIARGECVAFLDGDDQWKPDKISKQLAVLERSPDVALVGCGVIMVDETGRTVAEYLWDSPGKGPGALRDVALRRTWVGGSCSGAVVRRAVLDEVGLFDETLWGSEDLDLWLRILARHRVANVRELLAIILKQGKRNPNKLENNERRAYDAAFGRWPETFDQLTQRKIRAGVAARAGIEFADAGQQMEAMKRYGHALRQWPFDVTSWHLAARGTLKLFGI